MSKPVEVSWFSALCDDDYEFLGVPDPMLASSWEHCRNIVLAAEKGGFDNILLPSGYTLGLDTTTFASAIAVLTSRIKLLMAVRIGESWPPQLARQIATLDQISGGRLNVNIISSDVPGDKMDSEPRYRRTVEAMHILKALLNGEHLSIDGDHYKVDLDAPRIKTVSGKCPPLYFGGLSPAAKDAAAEGCDVYLMWPETVHGAKDLVDDMTARAAKAVHGIFGHVIAALDADFLDCIGHVFHSNSQKTFSNFLNRQPIADLCSHSFEFLTHNIHIERLICIWTKHGREKTK